MPYAWAASRPWGPTAEDIVDFLAATHNPGGTHASEDLTAPVLEEKDSDEGDVMSEGDDELLMAIDQMALEEECPTEQANEGEFTEDEDWLEDIGTGYLPSSSLQVPSKRHRY
ncbi:hypothetical protein M404DRAFT_31428 [Pisolithus tinctorius Marx 270]|uniref:Uncharacterized protein n=1 Tax=Pisolithus tinctorius Marx 270 TaxID=870435 RepID=A0A0C3NSE3_PISTI|nr:hypothetical protein M404DRAFT_31428 [Pisolithus tinctorius Marx 270]